MVVKFDGIFMLIHLIGTIGHFGRLSLPTQNSVEAKFVSGSPDRHENLSIHLKCQAKVDISFHRINSLKMSLVE